MSFVTYTGVKRVPGVLPEILTPHNVYSFIPTGSDFSAIIFYDVT